jgi:undecaprenol kinase
MKNQPFLRRLGFAAAGVMSALRSERSVKFHALAAVAAFVILGWLRPAPVWWAVVILIVALVLAAELLNTAIESLADLLHPEQDPRIGRVKDLAAAAVLVVSAGALAIAAALLFDLLR